MGQESVSAEAETAGAGGFGECRVVWVEDTGRDGGGRCKSDGYNIGSWYRGAEMASTYEVEGNDRGPPAPRMGALPLVHYVIYMWYS